MDQQNQHAKILETTGIVRPHSSSYQYSPAGAIQNMTPMARWMGEKAAEQPWDALASFKTDSGWRECVGHQEASSTKGQNGSVEEGTK